MVHNAHFSVSLWESSDPKVGTHSRKVFSSAKGFLIDH